MHPSVCSSPRMGIKRQIRAVAVAVSVRMGGGADGEGRKNAFCRMRFHQGISINNQSSNLGLAGFKCLCYACWKKKKTIWKSIHRSVRDTEKHVCGQMISILVTDVLRLLWQSGQGSSLETKTIIIKWLVQALNSDWMRHDQSYSKMLTRAHTRMHTSECTSVDKQPSRIISYMPD